LLTPQRFFTGKSVNERKCQSKASGNFVGGKKHMRRTETSLNNETTKRAGNERAIRFQFLGSKYVFEFFEFALWQYFMNRPRS
jgi:hypothetical protein